MSIRLWTAFENVNHVTQSLEKKFSFPNLNNKNNPFNELVYIILSTRTSSKKYQANYQSLRQVYRTAESFVAADYRELAKNITAGGLQNKKAKAIIEIASKLKDKFGKVTLVPLKEMETKQAESFLTSMPGVSLKVARCVLMYSLGRPVFPIDTHCFRIMKRLEWVNKKAKLTNRTSNMIQARIPEQYRKDLHIGLVVLGQKICHPTEPWCNICPILIYCPTGISRMADDLKEQNSERLENQ